jgi:hypothetical protein
MKYNYNNLLISILILAAAGYIYNKFKLNIDSNIQQDDLNIIKKYLLDDDIDNTIDTLSSVKKPILWIHIDYIKNSRKWESFGSRTNNEINQDYLYLTIRTIINKCSDYFHIIIIDDDSFCKLLENNCIDLNKVGNPIRNNLRSLNIMKLLYNYGGMYIENSFILFKSLDKIYDKVLESNKIVTGQFKNNGYTACTVDYMPSIKLIGCIKECPTMKRLINHMEMLYGTNYSGAVEFEDLISKWLLACAEKDEINVIDGRYIGTKDVNNVMVNLEEIMGSTFLELHSNAYALYIPSNELLRRSKYNWFCKLSSKEVLESNTILSKYLLLSNEIDG